MTTQMLFYERVTPVSKQRHADWCIDTAARNYEFARKVNSVPLTAVEIPLAAREYTIVFAGEEDAVVPVVILGIEGNDNVYVGADGSWNASYIPAFVRRYPFVFARSEDGKTFTLCIDESWSGCNQEGRGERLFDEDGEKAPYVENVLNFLQEYQGHFQLTQAYCQKLRELDLLEPHQAQLTLGDKRHQLKGFMAVNRKKLKELPGDTLSSLAATDELELTYTHLQSMNNFTSMLKRTAERHAGDADAADR
jgi:hypothetical protein